MSKIEAKNDVSSANPEGDTSNTVNADALMAQIAAINAELEQEKKEKAGVIRERNELKDLTRAKEKEFAEASGNIEEIRKAYDAEQKHNQQLLEQVKAEKEALAQRFQSVVVKDRIRSIAKDVVADSAFDDFWMIHGNEFELDDKENIKTKTGIKSPKERLQQIVTEKSFYKAVSAQSGSGMAKPNNTSTSSLSVDAFLQMSREEQRELATKNPQDFQKLMSSSK